MSTPSIARPEPRRRREQARPSRNRPRRSGPPPGASPPSPDPSILGAEDVGEVGPPSPRVDVRSHRVIRLGQARQVDPGAIAASRSALARSAGRSRKRSDSSLNPGKPATSGKSRPHPRRTIPFPSATGRPGRRDRTSQRARWCSYQPQSGTIRRGFEPGRRPNGGSSSRPDGPPAGGAIGRLVNRSSDPRDFR